MWGAILAAALTAAAAPQAAASAGDVCAPLHAALARLYHTPLRHSATRQPEGGRPAGTTEYVLTGDRQYMKFPSATAWMSTPLGEADRAALDDGVKAMTAPAEGRSCSAAGEEALAGEPMRVFLLHDEAARSDTRYWVSARTGLLVRSVMALAHGASLTDTYAYDNVKAPQ